MHFWPDAGATFPSGENGGFYYVSNSEAFAVFGGGVYSFEFDANGELIDYFNILRGTTFNCGGGKTPWGTWVSCEEFFNRGYCWQTDPSGLFRAEKTAVTAEGGSYESFAYDDRNEVPHFFVTEDAGYGPLIRFTPDEDAMNCYRQSTPRDRWCTLNSGSHEYLNLIPDDNGSSHGSFEWIIDKGATNAELYAGSEGIDVHEGMLYFTSKSTSTLLTLDLDELTYVQESTKSGAFNGSPDQVKRMINDESGILYFCQEEGETRGIFGRDRTNQFFTVLEGLDYVIETSGLAFSPDKKFMFVSFQQVGSIWQFWREDGLPFDGEMVDIRHHDAARRLIRNRKK